MIGVPDGGMGGRHFRKSPVASQSLPDRFPTIYERTRLRHNPVCKDVQNDDMTTATYN